jgi:transposase
MDELLMGVREAQRLGPVKAAIEGRITNAKGAELTGLSVRQFKRLKARMRRAGPHGLHHGNRGRPSPRRLDATVRAEVVTLLQHPEAQLNDCHVRDVLAERGIELSAETVRQVRNALGLKAKRRRRPARHLRRRLRAARLGSMVLIDGSPFAWMGPRLPPFTLVGTLDDATGEPLSLVRRPHEDLHGFTQALRDLIVTRGVPEALYGDRTTIAVRSDPHWTLEEELAGRQDPTHFGLMLEELGIRYIAAHTPEAKGRIERHWQTVQDRLPAEIALRGIDTVEAFDAFLPEFLRLCRKWFARPPRESTPAWRPVPPHLDRILACRYRRTVSRDNVVSIPGQLFQLPPGSHRRSFAHARVEVRELLDGRLLVLKDQHVLLQAPAPATAFTLVPRRSDRGRRTVPRADLAPRSSSNDDRPRPRLQSRVPKGDRELIARAQSRRRPPSHRWNRRPFKPPTPPLAAGTGG